MNNIYSKEQFLSPLSPSKTFTSEEVKAARENIESLSFPAGKEEKWKYTRPTKIINSSFLEVPASDSFRLEDFLIPGLECLPLVFINGFLNEKVSSQALSSGKFKIETQNLSEISEGFKSDIFSEINHAFCSGGVKITFPKDAKTEKPIHIFLIQNADNAISNPRLQFVAESFSESEVLISSLGGASGRTFTNMVMEGLIHENAHLSITKIQNDQDEALSLCNEKFHQYSNSVFSLNTFTFNGAFVRNNVEVTLDGENCECNLYGLYATDGHQHVDNHTLVDHRLPNSRSNELYRGILSGNSTGVFNGKVFVREQAQKTNAFQQNNNVILSDGASVNTKPELEIYADDVKCSHGCTIGEFDEEALFYLQSRAIGKTEAKNMLVTAFAEDVFQNVKNSQVKDYCRELLQKKFTSNEH